MNTEKRQVVWKSLKTRKKILHDDDLWVLSMICKVRKEYTNLLKRKKKVFHATIIYKLTTFIKTANVMKHFAKDFFKI